MTDGLGLAAFVLLTIVGIGIWRLQAVRRMDLAGRLAIAWAAGAVLTSVAMPLLSLGGVVWSRTTVGLTLGVIAAAGWFLKGTAGAHRVSFTGTAGIGVFVALTAYGALTARETCADLGFFWGPKAIAFVRDGGITPSFLADPSTFFMHRDYPLLVPMLYAWSNLVARDFPWWAALLTTALFVFGTAAVVRSASGDDAGATVVAGVLSYAIAAGYAAGGADPALVFFEALALTALTFIDDPRGRDVLAALGVAGAVWTKVEGATFAIAVFLAIALVQRRVKRAVIVVLPGAVILGAWLVFVVRHDLLDIYGNARGSLHLSLLPRVLVETAKSLSFDLYGLPWIVPLVLLAFGNVRRAALPLAVALLTIAAAIYFYLHNPAPSWWIAISARRVFLTPLVALLIAAVAAWRIDRDGGPEMVRTPPAL